MAYSSGTAAVVAAAAARKRMLNEEEEQMTNYSNDELEDDWEFKIVRAEYRAFSNPDKLTKLLSEEKQGGWVLLEKLDDSRVRFKRRRSAQAYDEKLISNGIDPYRTYYGMSARTSVALIGVLIIVVVVIGFTILLATFGN